MIPVVPWLAFWLISSYENLILHLSLDSKITLNIFKALDLKFIVVAVWREKNKNNLVSTYITLGSTVSVY